MDNLIFDRNSADVALSKELKAKVNNGTATDEEIALWNTNLKGSYNTSDLNRVESWTKYLNDKFNELGYRTERKLECIESTGTQYIDTGIVPNQDTRIILDFQYLSINNMGRLIGTRNSGNTNTQGFCFGTWGTSNIGNYNMYGSQEANYGLIDENRHILDFNKTVVSIDGVLKHTFNNETFTGYGKIYLFTYSTQTISANAIAKIYSLKIYQNEELKRDYIPAIDLNGVVCLYDKASQTYFYNEGTGEFIAGYKDGYKERPLTVDYIESTGTQYIDTGIKTTNKTRFELDVKYTRNNVSSTNGIAGFATNTRCCLGYSTDFTGFYFGVAGVNTHLGTKDLNRHQFYIDYKNSKFGISDLNLSGDITTQIAGGHNILLFARNNGNSNPDLPAYEKLYGCKIYEDDVLVRDYIPAIDPNNIVCLYDKVGNTYFYNQGTGNFKVGYKELVNPVYEVKDFTDTSLFNIVQNSTKTLVQEETPISNSFIRLSKTQWDFPCAGFTLANKPELQFDGNVVACVVYRASSENRSPRMGWSSATDGSSVWNNSAWDGGMPLSDKWRITRARTTRTNYSNYKKGSFGFCQQWMADNIVLDIAGISFYNLTDEQYADTDYINSLGVAGFGASAKPWEYQDDFVLAEADRIIHNINVLRSIIALYNDTPKTPETMRFLDYIKANNIEKILFDMDKLVNNMVANFRYSNDLISGEGYYS